MSDAESPDQQVRVDWLRRVFPRLGEPLLSNAARRLELVHVPAGTVLMRQGDVADGIFIVTRGSVSVVRPGRAGGATVVATLGPGQVFGEMATLAGVPRNATVSATTELEALKLDLEEVRRIITAAPGAARSASGNGDGSGALPGSIHTDWAHVVRSACHALVASRHAVKSIDVLGRPTVDDGPATLLQLTDLARRAASEYGVQVRVSHVGHRPVLHLTAAAD